MAYSRGASPSLLPTILLCFSLLISVNAFDPNLPTLPLTSNTTTSLPALGCTILTYPLTANNSLSLSLSVSPQIVALGYSTTKPTSCYTPDTAKGAPPDYVPLLDTTTTAAQQTYTLRNLTAERCWSGDITLYFSAATGWSKVFGREGENMPKNLAITVELQPTGNRTCSKVPAVPSENPTSTATQTSSPSPSWGLLPPPPGAKVIENAASSVTRGYIMLVGLAVLFGLIL